MSANAEPSLPRDEYVRRRAAHRSVRDELAKRQWRLGNLRGATAVSALVSAWAIWTGFPVAWAGIAAAVVLFIVLGVLHDRASTAKRRTERAIGWYERALSRLDDDWAGRGDAGERFADPHHLYAADLDLFGAGSLFERLATTRTNGGATMLAEWLKQPAEADVARRRHEAVRELQPKVELREDLWLIGADVPMNVDFNRLVDWGRRPSVFTSDRVRLAAAALSTLGMGTLILWLSGGPPSPFLVVVLVIAVLGRRLHSRVQSVLDGVDRRARELELLSDLLGRIEREPAKCKALVELRATLDRAGMPPSECIARLQSHLDWLEMRRNQAFAPFAPLLLWSFQWAFVIDRWRAAAGPAIEGWLKSVGEFEALAALSCYAYERPNDASPEILDEGPVLCAEVLAHPLLSGCVPNDLSIGGDLRLLVVSGSNMSGKSTFLRTIGVNVVLALAGAPVCARSMRLSPLGIGATLRIQDSLREGKSRFFAEITRIRELLDRALAAPPLLVLLDEVFHGTNSHDRQIGAAAVIRILLDRGAVGLVTTHDLALTPLAEELAPRVANVHFEDQFEGGSIHFDYRMRPGVVPRSNALALMRAVGIDV